MLLFSGLRYCLLLVFFVSCVNTLDAFIALVFGLENGERGGVAKVGM